MAYISCVMFMCYARLCVCVRWGVRVMFSVLCSVYVRCMCSDVLRVGPGCCLCVVCWCSVLCVWCYVMCMCSVVGVWCSVYDALYDVGVCSVYVIGVYSGLGFTMYAYVLRFMCQVYVTQYNIIQRCVVVE